MTFKHARPRTSAVLLICSFAFGLVGVAGYAQGDLANSVADLPEGAVQAGARSVAPAAVTPGEGSVQVSTLDAVRPEEWERDTLLTLEADDVSTIDLIRYLAGMVHIDVIVTEGCEGVIPHIKVHDRTASEIIAMAASASRPALSIREQEGVLTVSASSQASGEVGAAPPEGREWELTPMVGGESPSGSGSKTGEAISPEDVETRTYELQFIDPAAAAEMLGGVALRVQASVLSPRAQQKSNTNANTGRYGSESFFGGGAGVSTYSMAGLGEFGQIGGYGGGGGYGGRGGGGGYGGRGGGGGGYGGRGGGGYGGGGYGGGGYGGGGYGGGGYGGTFFRPEGLIDVMGVVELNTLILRGTPEGIDQTIEVLRSIDRPAKQVLLEVQVVNVARSEDDNVGVNWALSGPNMTMTAQYGGDAVGNLNIGYVNGDARVLISALTTDNRGDIISSPRIVAMNNTPAYLYVGEIIPTFIPRRDTDIGGNIIVTWEEGDEIETGAELNVTPRINGDNSVTLYLAPTFTELGQRVVAGTGATETVSYRTLEREFETIVRVRDGQTVVIGGFTSHRVDDNRYKVPGLSEIPILGALFRGRSKTVTDSDLLWFFTPRIVHDYEEPPDL